MPSVFVVYEKKAGARFDRHYCTTAHMDLIREVCGPHGLEGVSCHLALEEQSPFEAIMEVRYRDVDGLKTVLANPESRRIFADIARFTDILPRIGRMT